VHENLGLVWVWPGDPEKADPALCFDLPAWHEQNRAITGGGYHRVLCNYQMITDNLTDPAHTAFVHRSTLGSPEQEEVPVHVREVGDVVEVSRWTLNSPPAGVFTALAEVPALVDRWQYYYLHCPSVCVVDFGICEVGALSPEDVRDGEGTIQAYSVILMAPESLGSTHYFYMQVRNFAVSDRSMDDRVRAQIAKAFDEDFLILESQQQWQDNYPPPNQVQLALDRAPKLQRAIVQRMIQAEATQ
jgi:vanillate O-demethylase monooxygenase subunit